MTKQVVRGESPVEILRRWEDAGAHWRVTSRSPSWVEVALFTCDGGEVVDRLSTDDPALLHFLGERTTSEP